MSPSNKMISHQITIYFPKHERNFMIKLDEFVKQEYPGESMSWFIMLCVKHFINSNLTRDQKKRFRKISYEISGVEEPGLSDALNKLRKENK